MKKINVVIKSIGAVIITIILSIIISVIVLTPKADKIKLENKTDSYFITNSSYIDYQENNECSAYAAAYILRCMNENVSGKELYPEMKRFFGLMTVNSVVNVIERHGYSAKAYHGNTDTLKQRLISGYPIICFIKNEKDTHYVVVVGFDTDYIYIVDSLNENTNVFETDLYNRKVTTKDFEALWKNNLYFVNNLYIIIE